MDAGRLAPISKDLPPFCIARGDNGICGLNTVGLRRAGFTAEERLALKRARSRLLLRSGQRLKTALETARIDFGRSAPARHGVGPVRRRQQARRLRGRRPQHQRG
jgi:acyl-[acyl carrier protein]--UDP-N-acetylglucosamine O-acyltransferase